MSLLHKFLPRIDFSSYEDFFVNYRVNVPDNFNFGFDIVDAYAENEPERKALVWCNDHDEEKTITFGELKCLSNKTANLLTSLGLKKGDVCMMILRRRWEYWICATALHKVGVTLIPATIQLTTKDIVYRADAAGAKAIICVDDDFVIAQATAAFDQAQTLEHKIVVAGKREGWLNFDEAIASQSEEFARPIGEAATKKDDIMLIYFTSGTTGYPKMVSHNFAHPLGHIVTAKYWQQVEDEKLHMSVSDSGWAKFGWGKIYGQWIAGATIFAYDMDKFIPAKLLQKMQDYKLTTFCAPPTMYRFMLQEDVASYDLSSIHNFATAGEPLNPEVFNKWKELTGKEIREGFGQSESSVLVANFPWITPRPGSMGKPSPLYGMRLLNEDGKECADGEEGEMCVTSISFAYPPGLFVAYNKNPELTKEKLGGAYYGMSDVAWRDSAGYWWFVGRHDDVIKCSGYRIGPFEVESALLEHPAVVESAVTAAPDPVRGNVVKATIVLAQGYEPSPELIKELQNHVKKTTAPYKYPRIIEFVDELPKTIGGKIKRAQIRHIDTYGTDDFGKPDTSA